MGPGRRHRPPHQVRRGGQEPGPGPGRGLRPADRRHGHRAHRARAHRRRRHDPLPQRRSPPRPGAGHRLVHADGPVRQVGAVHAGRHRRGRRRLLGPGGLPGARRRHPPPPLQRARDRHLGAADQGRHLGRAGRRRRPPGTRRPLAGPGDPALLAAHAASASTCRPARSSPWSRRGAASPARWPSWCWPPTGPSCSRAPSKTPTTTCRRPRWCSPTPTTAGTRMSNGLTRLQSRFYGRDDAVEAVRSSLGKHLLAEEASSLGLVTFTPDDIDWEDEIRLCLEERASFSPDALTGLEANYRFVGPETMETKIFGRLTAWQNWIFQRPNASGPDGALRRYGTGSRPSYDRKRSLISMAATQHHRLFGEDPEQRRPEPATGGYSGRWSRGSRSSSSGGGTSGPSPSRTRTSTSARPSRPTRRAGPTSGS